MVAWSPRGGEGVGDTSDNRVVGEGETRRLESEVLRGEGDPNTSSDSIGIVFGLGPTPVKLSLLSPDGTLFEMTNGDLETYSFFANLPRPILGRAVFFPLPSRTSGESFSLLPETLLSPETRRSRLVGGMTTFLSEETLLVPFNADPDPLGVLVDGRLVADMPNPMAALGVEAAPTAFSGDAPITLEALFSCRTSCLLSFQIPAAC